MLVVIVKKIQIFSATKRRRLSYERADVFGRGVADSGCSKGKRVRFCPPCLLPRCDVRALRCLRRRRSSVLEPAGNCGGCVFHSEWILGYAFFFARRLGKGICAQARAEDFSAVRSCCVRLCRPAFFVLKAAAS